MNEIKIHHQRLRRARGPASSFTCVACDRPAYEWAYQHGNPAPLFSPRGEVYSLDFDDYAPMCRSCHRRLDFQMSARQRESSRRNIETAREGLQRAWVDDRERLAAASRENVRKAKAAAMERMTPEDYARAGRLGGTARSARMKDDPALRDRLAASATENLRRANAIRRVCDECGREMRPASMGNHQKSSGHRGWTDRKD